jgi:glycosyltransferase involved in cell wall biosynthesis
MRICHVLTDAQGGGLVYARALAAAAEELGAQVDWIHPGATPVRPSALRAACAGADLVHCHGIRAGLLTAPFGRRLVVTPHGSHLVRRRGIVAPVIGRAAVRALARRSDAIICVGREERRVLRQVLGAEANRLVLVLNGSPAVTMPDRADRARARLRLAIDESAPVLAFVGRLERQKDPELAIAAFEQARITVPAAQLVMVGDGALSRTLLRRRLPGVRLLGSRPDAADVIVAADALINTSFWEGMPLSLLEGLWRGRPAVAVAAPGNAEALGDAGIVVGSRDPVLLGRAVAGLLSDTELLVSLGLRARLRAERLFSQERMIDETLEVYKRLVRGLPARTARLLGTAEVEAS